MTYLSIGPFMTYLDCHESKWTVYGSKWTVYRSNWTVHESDRPWKEKTVQLVSTRSFPKIDLDSSKNNWTVLTTESRRFSWKWMANLALKVDGLLGHKLDGLKSYGSYHLSTLIGCFGENDQKRRRIITILSKLINSSSRILLQIMW